jgi:hypothetical protein
MHFDFTMDAEDILNLWKKLRDYSFINVGNKHFNKINIAYIDFPDDAMLEDLIICLTDKDYSDWEWLDEWTFVKEPLSLNDK